MTRVPIVMTVDAERKVNGAGERSEIKKAARACQSDPEK
jgi:hypothetical protein